MMTSAKIVKTSTITTAKKQFFILYHSFPLVAKYQRESKEILSFVQM